MIAQAPAAEQPTTPLEALAASARYVVDAKGQQVEVLLPLPAWQKLLAWLEDVEDRALVREALPRLKAGPAASGALRWEEVRAEWDDDTAV